MEDFDVFDIICENWTEDTDSEPEHQTIKEIVEYELESGILTFPENIQRINPKLIKKYECIREIRFYPLCPIENISTIHLSMFANIEMINIPRNVKSITTSLFKGYKKLNSVVFESQTQLENICDYAFYECESLKHIDLPYSLQAIYQFSFSKSGLIHLDMSQCRIKIIGEGAFKDCLMLESVVMPKEVDVIPKSLFENCSKLSSVEFPEPNSFLRIEERAFCSCTSLCHIKIPSGVNSIKNNAFCESGLIEINLNDSLTSLGNDSFGSCKSLKSAHISKKLKILPHEAFNSCSSLISLTFDDDSELENIESCCFRETSIETITLPASLKHINCYAFDQIKLKQVNFSDDSKLEIIEPSAFLSAIEKIDLPPNLKCISLDSFNKSTHLNFDKCKYIVRSSTGVIYNRTLTRIFDIPSSLRHFVIPESVTLLDMKIFSDTRIKSINVPASVESMIQSDDIPKNSIERVTFSKDSRLKLIDTWVFRSADISRISIPSSVEKLRRKVFQDCSFDRIRFQDNSKLKKLVQCVFYYSSIVQIDIPSSVEIIKYDAFACCNIEIINFSRDSRLKIINYKAFYGCRNIRSINLENCKYLKTIERKAFDENVFEMLGIKPFVSMEINEEGRLVNYDHDVRVIDIPDDVVSIGPKLFFNSIFEKIIFHETSSLKTICKCSFSLSVLTKSFHRELNKIIFPASLELIEEYVFYGSEYLQGISFMEGSKLMRIKKYAFAFCYRLKYIELPEHEVVIEKEAFKCSGDYPKSSNIVWEEETDLESFNCYEEEVGENLEFDSPIIVIPASIEKILSINNKQNTTKITYEEGSNLKEILYFNCSENADVFLPPSVEKIQYDTFFKLRSLNIMNHNFKTSGEGVVTSYRPRAILFVPPNVESIDIDPELEIIFSFAFYKSRIKSISLPRTLKIIGQGAFLDSSLENIEFAEGTELDLLDTESLCARNLRSVKLPNVRGEMGYSIIVKDFLQIEFPKNFCPKICNGGLIEFSNVRQEDQRIILPFSSIESIFDIGIASTNNRIMILYDQ